MTSLVELFALVRDPRKRRGVRHRCAAVLTLMVLAVLCGAGNFRQAADRVAEMPQAFLAAAGARAHPVLGVRLTPSRDTIRRLVEAIDAPAVDLLVCRWMAARLIPDGGRLGVGLAVDGKTVRNSGGGASPDAKLFSAMRHDTAVVIGQVQVPADTTEVTQIEALLGPIQVAGMVVTADAAHPNRDTAEYLTGRGADYVFTVKGNKPSLLAAIWNRVPTATADTATHVEEEHRNGMIIRRWMWTADADGVDFPAAAQVFRLRRDTYNLSGQRISKEIIHGITSLSADDATAGQLAGYVREHWGIENKIHWVRDVLFAEDHQHAYTGHAAHGMALLRNLALGLIRLAGHTKIKQVLERNHGNKTLIPALLKASRP
ncbi:ISAs1 family transposase [Micromonospora sp. GCM10011541]|uniref:ISAs1 family transposase n=1 Tax=Micromonospora sp. GCM10011541 TaxID=3317336 RepID=UPI00360A7947